MQSRTAMIRAAVFGVMFSSALAQTAASDPGVRGALPGAAGPLDSDLLVHNMGAGLADGIRQGLAGPDEFRTAPLWGVGQRLFFLHEGRTSDLLTAIRAHRSHNSEANAVIGYFESLSEAADAGFTEFPALALSAKLSYMK